MMSSFESWILEMATCGLPMSVVARRVGWSRPTFRRLVRRACASQQADEQDDEANRVAQAEGQEVLDDLT
jgi:hypothetical protein